MKCFTVVDDSYIYDSLSVINRGIGRTGFLATVADGKIFPEPELSLPIGSYYRPNLGIEPLMVIRYANVFCFKGKPRNIYTSVIYREQQSSEDALVFWTYDETKLTFKSVMYDIKQVEVVDERYRLDPGHAQILLILKKDSFIKIVFEETAVTLSWDGNHLTIRHHL